MMLINLLVIGFIGLCILTAYEAAVDAEELVKFYEEESK